MTKQELLIAACKSGNMQQLEEALKEGFFTKKIDIDTIKDSDGHSPLCVAILSNNLGIVKELLKMQVRVDEKDNLPLKYAIHSINIPLIELLIQNGADVNKTVPYPTSYRPTPLNYALELDRDYRTNDEIDEVCAFLILAGANLYSPNNDGESPITQVIRHNLLKSLDAMLNRNIDLSKTDGRFKETPLAYAGSLKRYDIVKKLSRNDATNDGQNSSDTNRTEIKKYTISVEIAKVMGEPVYAKYNGESSITTENWIVNLFKEFPGYLDFSEKPRAFMNCSLYFHKRVDIHEAAAIMMAEQGVEPSANTRIDASGKMEFCFTGIQGFRTSGKIAWPGGEMQIVRILMPSVDDEKYDLVITDN